MTLFNKLVGAVEKVSTPRNHKVKTHKSLKAIMEAVDFNVFRYRKKTGREIIGKRGGKDFQRKYTDSTKINLPGGYKIYAFNIDQFLQKLNAKPIYKTLSKNNKKIDTETTPSANGTQILSVIDSDNGFSLRSIPKEIISDLKLQKNKAGNYIANKQGYSAWIEKEGSIYPLRKTKYSEIKIEGSSSKKMIYRRFRDGSLEASFIKVLGSYIASTVVSPEGKALIDIDIEPKNYVPKKENTENTIQKEAKVILGKGTLELDIVEHDEGLENVKIETLSGVIEDMKNDSYQKEDKIEWNDFFDKIEEISSRTYEKKEFEFSFENLTDTLEDMLNDGYSDSDTFYLDDFERRIKNAMEY